MPRDYQYDPNAGDYVLESNNPAFTTAGDGKGGRCLAVRYGEWVSADGPEDVFGNKRWKETQRANDTPKLRNEARRFDVESLSPLVKAGIYGEIDEIDDVETVDLGEGFGNRISVTDQTAIDQEGILVLEAYGRKEAE